MFGVSLLVSALLLRSVAALAPPVRAVTDTSALPAPAARVVANDNTQPAGRLRHDTLRLSLVARLGEWHPNGDAAPGVEIPAFAEEGQLPRVPGPLVRVPVGTTVIVSVRNVLPSDTLRLAGLHARPLTDADDSATVVLPPGATHAVRFRLDAPGTYYYWGTTMRRVLPYRTGLDAQLTGAIIVEPPGTVTYDRVMVLGMWTDTVARSFLPRHRVLGVVNGRSWPHTERLTASVGDTVRWRIINASGDLHPMHLHGFYFTVTSRGDGTTDTLFAPGLAPKAVTEAMNMGATYAMTWVPEREGNWLFHCHIPEHFGPRLPLGLPPDSGAAHEAHATTASHARAGMSGMVLGITVSARRTAGRLSRVAPVQDAGRTQRMRLLVRENTGSTAAVPMFSYAPHVSGTEPPRADGRSASPPLIVVRGVPVRIMVVNQLAEPTAVHWHGIELESVYDGVPGFSGTARHLSPLVAPGDSFEVRFTPPRAGTFIYHTHHEEDRQQGAGLAAPLIVREDSLPFDAGHDFPLLLTSPADHAEAAVRIFVNAAATPPAITIRQGDTARVRLINMTLRRSGIRVRLKRDGVAMPWRLVAKDGATLPAAQVSVGPWPQLLSIGETRDLEFTAERPGELSVEFRVGPQPDARVLAVQSFRVVPR